MRLAFLVVSMSLFATGAFAQAGEGEGEGEGGGPPPPAGWTCDAAFYGASDGCDCGCGVADLDCPDATLASCGFNDCEFATPGTVPQAADTTKCTTNACGDGILDGTEECDDGNTTPGDGCSATCTVETSFTCTNFDAAGKAHLTTTCHAIVCGDGKKDSPETCDDGNTAAGDGCSSTCTIETGFACPTAGSPCIAVPAAWTCDPTFFHANDGCDCGCGVTDPDCPTPASASDCIDDCSFTDPTKTFDPNNVTQCIAAPPTGEGEGEGGAEGEGAVAGEGEGEGEGSTRPIDTPNKTPGGCAASPVTSSTVPAEALLLGGLALLFVRRRTR